MKLKALGLHPAPWALLTVLLVESVLPGTLRKLLPEQVTHHRNPSLQRNWDEYLTRTARKEDPEIRILLISNSQGVGRDLPEERIYATILEERLSAALRPRRVRVINWSCINLMAAEMIVLGARARELDPHLVLVVQNLRQFTNANLFRPHPLTAKPRPGVRRGEEWQKVPLSSFGSDICETAWFHRAALSGEFRDFYLDRDLAPVAQALAARHWPLYRYRDLLQDYGATHPALRRFFPPDTRKGLWHPVAAKVPPTEDHPALARDFALVPGFDAAFQPKLLKMMADTYAGLKCPKVYIEQPFNPDLPFSDEQKTEFRSNLTRFRNLLLARGWVTHNLSPWTSHNAAPPIPAVQFEDYTHLWPKGQRRFAELLEPIVLDALRKAGTVP